MSTFQPFNFNEEQPMTALARINTSSIPGGIPGVSIETVRRIAGRAIWAWFYEHQEEVVFEKKVFFFAIKLRIRDLRFLIERIAGPEVV